MCGDTFREDWDEDDWREDRAHDEMEVVRERWIERGWWDLKLHAAYSKGGENGMFPDVELTRLYVMPSGPHGTWGVTREVRVWISSAWLLSQIMEAEECKTTDKRAFVSLTTFENHTLSFRGTIEEIRAKLGRIDQNG